MKKVGPYLYAHISALKEFSAEDQSRINWAAMFTPASAGRWNVVKFSRQRQRLSLLQYDNFMEDPFPQLKHSWTVDWEPYQMTHRSYRCRTNPPILHRKELLLPAEHPRRELFAALTAELERAGLFKEPAKIGTELAWDRLLYNGGWKVVDHKLLPCNV